MSALALCYSAMLFVAGFFMAYFFLVARALARQVESLREQLRTAYGLMEFLDELESHPEKIEDSLE